MLVRNEIIEKVSTRALPVQVVRHCIPEPAGVLVTKATSSDQQSHGNRDSQDHGKGKGESLYDNLTGKLCKDVGQVRGDDLYEENVEGCRPVRTDFYVFLQKLSSGNVWKCVRTAGTHKAVMNLGNVDGVPVESCCELGEEGSNLGGVEVQEQQGAGEEENDLPHGDKHVGEVSVFLLPLLDAPQLLDEAPRGAPVDKVLPPSG